MGHAEGDGMQEGWVAAAVGTAAFVLYLLTLCPVVFWYDSAEYVTAAVTLGIPHPPGYPLYTMLGHAFTWLPLDPALAVNGMSATFAALAVSVTYLVCRRLGADRIPSIAGSALLGVGELFWANALVAEVYCPALAFVALVLYLLLRSRDESRFGWSVLAAFIAGLGLGVHFSIATLGLGMVLLVLSFDLPARSRGVWIELLDRDGLGMRVKRCAVAAGATLLGSSIFLYLPLRAMQDPPLNLGDPSNLERFLWVVSGGSYKEWFRNELSVVTRAGDIVSTFVDQLHFLGVLFAVVGVLGLWRRRPVECLAFILMALGNIVFFFRYEVHDVAVFFLPTTLLLCCAAAVGVQDLIESATRLASSDRIGMIRRLASGALVLFVLVVALGNYRTVDMSDFRETEVFIEEMVDGLPESALILNFTSPSEWQLDAVFGMYVQKVLQQRTDVEVLVPTDLRVIETALGSNRPTYVYAPIDLVTQNLEIVREGPLYRVLGRRPRPN